MVRLAVISLSRGCRMKAVRALAVLVAAVLLPVSVHAQKAPSVADVVRAAADYLASYTPRISGVTLEEEFTLLEVSGGRLGLSQRIASDFVLLNLNGTVAALRDPFAVDTNPLRERTPRLTTLLQNPTGATWRRAQEHAAESRRDFLDELIVRLAEPELTLQFVAPENQPRVTYKIDGRKKLGDVETVVLRFQEIKTKPPAYILQTPGNAISNGKLWIDPATGRVHRTELSMQSDSESVHVVVEYARDAALDLWLPSSMTGTFDATERVGTGMNTMGAGRPEIGRRSFECRVNYSNARLTPIDLRIRQ